MLRVMSGGSPWSKDFEWCAAQDSQVEAQRPTARVRDVHVEGLTEGGVGACRDLPETRHPLRYQEALEVMASEVLGLIGDARARSHERHLSAKDVQQLRQLVEARAS